MSELIVGRQPILNGQKETVAYELLYRAFPEDTSAVFKDGNSATSRVFANTIFEMGLDAVVGPHLAFINITRDFIVHEDLLQLLTGIRSDTFDPRRVVLEVLEDVSLDQELFRSLRLIKDRNFLIALDDVNSFGQIASIIDKKLVDLVKVDLLAVNRAELSGLVEAVKQRGILLLAEKVETPQDFMLCSSLGFDFFQGYFFCKPETLRQGASKLDVSRMGLMRSLSAAMVEQASFQGLDPVISQDVGLSYKLLRLVNSGYYSLSNPVRSIQQAIGLIGLQQLRSWMMLLLMATVDDKPHELTVAALQRARMCEMAARAIGIRQAESYFLLGLLSVLDAILDAPMHKVAETLSLAPEITLALTRHEGSLGKVLKAVIATESGDWNPVMQLGILPEVWRGIYFEAVKSSAVVMRELYPES